MESGRVPETGPATATPAPAQRPAFERFGRYFLLERIGKGGMAEVYRAVSQGAEGFRRMFVVKRILAEKASSPEFIEMFCAEARICALLHHPNIVQVYDFGHVGGSYFLAMEYVLGKDLSSVMRVLRESNMAVPPTLAAFIAQQVAIGLGYAHTLRSANGQPLGIVHRDVTPSNIMLVQAGGVKVLDFGIAKAASATEETGGSGGSLKGKLRYLAPEQVRLGEVDARADIFSLGVTLWEMLTGKRLFAGANEFETLRNVLQRPVPAPSTLWPGVPPELDRVVLRALERELDRRYQTAQEMANDLEQILRDARYESQSLRRLLSDLFGDESSSLSLDVPELPAESGRSEMLPAPQPRLAVASSPIDIEFVETRAVPPRTRSKAPPFGVATTTSAAALPELRPGARLGRRLGWGGGVVLIALAALGLLGLRAASRPRSVARPAAAAAAAPRPRAAAPAPTAVKLELDSSPRGAAVLDSQGQRIGLTPLSVMVARSERPRSFTVARDGYKDAVYEMAPQRDAVAFIELERLRAPAAPASRRAVRGHGAAPRDLGASLTINPF